MQPLAERLRPTSLDNYIGQQHLVGEDAVLRKKKVFFPKSNDNGTMEFYQVVSIKQLESGYKGIKEPVVNERYLYRFERSEDTLVIVPGVAFDANGYRVGYGKGFYDRFLEQEPNHPTLALCYDFQVVEKIESKPWDVPLDIIITETKIIKMKN